MAVDILEALGPRHRATAARWAVVVTAVGAVVTAIFAVVTPSPSLPAWAAAIAPVVLAAACLALLRGSERLVSVLCVVVPLATVVLVTGLAVARNDASVAGEAFFWLPVLFAASQLKPVGGALVTVTAVAGCAVASLSVETTTRGLTDLAYIGVTLVVTGTLLARAGVVQDQLTVKLIERAAVDPLTGLVTRRVLDDATQAAISGGVASMGTALLLLDIDHFKSVNDNHGHPIGDAALAHVGRILSNHSRAVDVVARMGGDEMAVLMPGCTYRAAVERAEQIVVAVRATPLALPDGSTLELSVSAGVSHAPDFALYVRDLYISADQALYTAKRGGRNRVGSLPIGPVRLN